MQFALIKAPCTVPAAFGRHPARHTDGLRSGQHARLRLSKPGKRCRSHRPPDRPQLPPMRSDGVAYGSENPYRNRRSAMHPSSCAASGRQGAYCGHRCRAWALCLEAVERPKPAARVDPVRTTARSTCADGSKLIVEMKLQDVARFEKGDAFDEKSVAAIQPRPNDRDRFRPLRALYRTTPGCLLPCAAGPAVESGGFLIYTGQPWHPQLEMIARTLTSHRDNRRG